MENYILWSPSFDKKTHETSFFVAPINVQRVAKGTSGMVAEMLADLGVKDAPIKRWSVRHFLTNYMTDEPDAEDWEEVWGDTWEVKVKGLTRTPNFNDGKSPLWRCLIIPQAWSIAIEETFYLCAPFINALRTGALLLILVLSLGARLYVYSLGGLHDPWTYRFSPFELGLFVLGILSFRAYSHFRLSERVPSFPSGWWYLAAMAILTSIFALHAHILKVSARLIGEEAAILLSYPL